MGPGSVPGSVSMLAISPAEGTHQRPPHSSQRALFFLWGANHLSYVCGVGGVEGSRGCEWGCSLQASHNNNNTNTRFQTLNAGKLFHGYWLHPITSPSLQKRPDWTGPPEVSWIHIQHQLRERVQTPGPLLLSVILENNNETICQVFTTVFTIRISKCFFFFF